MKAALYAHIAQLVDARLRCLATPRTHGDWAHRHGERVRSLAREHLPHGSGFDSGCQVDLDASTSDKLVIRTSYHHMDENGSYDGWTEHVVTVRPSLAFGTRMTVSGRNRNDIKDYILETFHEALHAEIDTQQDTREERAS